MRVLICGGRLFGCPPTNATSKNIIQADIEAQFIFDKLDLLDKDDLLIIQGEAKGADRVAKIWAINNEVEILSFPADWKNYGRAAGIIRNTQMLEEGEPDLLIAFPGGTGTKNMVDSSCKVGVKVLIYDMETK